MESGQSILVTGGAGFVGANVVDRALMAGHRVTVLDDLSRAGSEQNVIWLRERHGDAFQLIVRSVADPDACIRAVDDAEIVYHLAGQVAVTTSVTDPRHDFEVNALGTFNILEAARRSTHNPILLYSSTNKVYGGLDGVQVVEETDRYAFADLPLGIPETQPMDFHSPYGCSKGSADQYVRDYARIYGLPTVVFRQSCIYGQRQMGVEDQGWVAWFVIAALTGQPITIYGDGKQVRDLLHIDDLANAFEAAIANIETAKGNVYNIGGGPENSISIWRDFKPILEASLGRAVPEPAFAPSRPGDQEIYVSDISKASRELDWQPTVGVEEGIEKLVEWAQANQQLFS